MLRERIEHHSCPEPNSGCWLWFSSVMRRGYGQLTYGGKHWNAPRASWTAFRGPIPTGAHVLHRCNNTSCVNPDHLYLGGDWENARDRLAAGTHRNPPRLVGSAHPNALIDEEIARAIKYASGSYREIAGRYGVSKATVSHIKRGRQWGHV